MWGGLGVLSVPTVEASEVGVEGEHLLPTEARPTKVRLGPSLGRLNRAGSAHRSVSRTEATCHGRLVPGDLRSPSPLLPGGPLNRC